MYEKATTEAQYVGCVGVLIERGYVKQYTGLMDGMPTPVYSLSHKGRTYRSELCRHRIQTYAPVIIGGILGIIGTGLGVLLGFHLDHF